MSKLADKKKLLVQVRRALRRVDARETVSPENMRKVIQEVVNDVYRQNGKDLPQEEMEQAVNQVLKEVAPSENEQEKKKIPLHYWILGSIVAIPLLFPLVRLTEAIVLVLLRVVI